MAVRETTEPRCKDSSVQERWGMQTLHPFLHLLFYMTSFLGYALRLLGDDTVHVALELFM